MAVKRKLSKLDWVLFIVPAIGWMANYAIRPHVVDTPCADQTGDCNRSDVLWFDEPVIDYGHYATGDYAHFTQDTSGVLAMAVPFVYSGARILAGTASPAVALTAAGVDLVIFVEAAVWNGFVNATTRNVFPRARPFVYQDPETFGGDVGNYTSFYSGHTSFAALSMTSLALALAARGAGIALVAPTGVAGVVLVAATGVFRVLSGRHFISDVVFAAIAGMLIALWIAWLHRPRSES